MSANRRPRNTIVIINQVIRFVSPRRPLFCVRLLRFVVSAGRRLVILFFNLIVCRASAKRNRTRFAADEIINNENISSSTFYHSRDSSTTSVKNRFDFIPFAFTPKGSAVVSRLSSRISNGRVFVFIARNTYYLPLLHAVTLFTIQCILRCHESVFYPFSFASLQAIKNNNVYTPYLCLRICPSNTRETISDQIFREQFCHRY